MTTEDYASLSRQDTPPTILFIGDSTCFSNMYIRLVQSEFPDIDIERAINLTEARQDSLYRNRAVEAVVFACRNGRDAVAELQAQFQHDTGLRLILAYQTISEVRSILDAIESRAIVERLSFLPLRARMDCTVTILRLVLSGERHVSGEVMDTLMAWKSTDTSETHDGWTLTAREKEVLEHLAKGASNKLIALELDLAESTVKLHIHHIIHKLGVSNRTEAAVAYVAGLAKTHVTT